MPWDSLPADELWRKLMHFVNQKTIWVFGAAAALAAAAVADPVVECMSNAGVFGPGTFTDHSNLDVLPALGIALVLSSVIVVLLARRMLKRNTTPAAWLQHCAAAIASRSVWRFLPLTFGFQIAALCGMETLEQIAVVGHPLGGALWLGGPVAVSLALHAISCVLFTWLVSSLVTWSACSIVRVVRRALERLRALRDCTPPPRLGARRFAGRKFVDPYFRVLHGRAPPVLSGLNA